MKSTVVDESLSTNATRVLFPRKTTSLLQETTEWETYTKLTEEYLDRYIGVRPEILNMTRFDKMSDLSTTALGRSTMIRDHKMAPEERFPMSEQGYTMGEILDGLECQINLDTGVSKCLNTITYIVNHSTHYLNLCLKHIEFK